MAGRQLVQWKTVSVDREGFWLGIRALQARVLQGECSAARTGADGDSVANRSCIERIKYVCLLEIEPAGEVAKGTDLKTLRLSRRKRDEEPDKRAELELFNYIEQYYEPYATKHSVTAIEIVRILKREFEFLKHKPIDQIDSDDIEQWRTRRSK